jgi:hypothetical protein
MTTSEAVTGAPHAAASGRRPSLLRAELRRFAARRFIRLLLALAVGGYLVVMTLVAVTQFAKPSPAGVADGQRRLEQAVDDAQRARQVCLDDADRPADVPEQDACGSEITPESFRVEDFMAKRPFALADALSPGALAMGVAAAALAFLVGATYVGAEWSTRSMVALLFWEPRRLRVMRTKLAVTAATAALIGALAQALWAGTAVLIALTRGNTRGVTGGLWADVLAQQGRLTVLAALLALLGFGLANLVRNTGAALGVGFLYVAVVEPAVRALRPTWQPWLLTDNVAALALEGGHRVAVPKRFVDPTGQVQHELREITLSNLHGALVLGGVSLAVVTLGVVLFLRRDLH